MSPIRKLELVDRDKWILTCCRGENVLHIGCTDYPLTETRVREGRLLHALLHDCANVLVGLDIDGIGIEAIRQMIPDCLVLHHDAEQLERCDPLKKMQYDIIVAADVLEHLSNVGLFLSGARAFMRPDDRLLITTPNAYSMKRMLIPLPKLHESTASRVVRLRSGG